MSPAELVATFGRQCQVNANTHSETLAVFHQDASLCGCRNNIACDADVKQAALPESMCVTGMRASLIHLKMHQLMLFDAAGSIVQFHSIPGKPHGMISGPAEMRLLMAFWAQSLRHRPVQASTDRTAQASFVEVQGGAQTVLSLQKQN